MPLDTQAYLLRVLESGEYIKVGSSSVKKTDVRIIAATNVSLDERVRNGKFREDLYYRLNTVPIKVPALHERREDIYMLFRKFAIDFSEKYRSESVALDERARLIVENYSWPGNVRELKNLVEQLSVMSDKPLLEAEDLLDLAPQLLKRNLPALSDRSRGNGSSGGGDGFQEREILFKFLLEMKTDLNDLKSLVYELINTNDLAVPDRRKVPASSTGLEKYMDQNNIEPFEGQHTHQESYPTQHSTPYYDTGNGGPIILDRQSPVVSHKYVYEIRYSHRNH